VAVPPHRREAARALRELERLKATFGPDVEPRKRALLTSLERARLARAHDVMRLHEALCFLRAYPDSPATRTLVERMLARFAQRPDLRRHAVALADTGIAGTTISFRFFAPTARWLVERWPRQIEMVWSEFDNSDELEALLPLLAHPAESPGLDEIAYSLREWIARMKSRDESDGAFLVRRLAALPMSDPAKEILYDRLDPTLRLTPGPGTPSRTLALVSRRGAPEFQRRPLERSHALTRADVLERPPVIRRMTQREARALIDLAREAMVTRQRDLDVFSYADPRDVTWVEFAGGLAFACLGAIPARRLMLESVYGFLTLKNGVPIGYVLTSALFGSSELAYNVFETFRGAEAGAIYRRVLEMTHAMFGSDTFVIFPYQLGEGNDEALQSGAWWFYHKVGFRPRSTAAQRIMRREMARMQKNPAHRSSLATLKRLAEHSLYFTIEHPRHDVIGRIELPNVGLHVTRYLARRFGGRGDRGSRACAEEARKLLAVRSHAGWSQGERLAWERWAPLVLILPGVRRWSSTQRRALVAVIRAKGGRSEMEFVRRFDAHRPLRSAIAKLAASPVDR
jgi:hypothetical protein